MATGEPQRIALITGATRGIGSAVAKRFAREGMHIIAVGRHQQLLEELDDDIKLLGGSATLVQLDLLETDKIEILAANIAQRFGKLDILVGNAGLLGELTPVPHATPSEWDKVMAVNVTANFHLIRCFDMLLKASEHPRAMFVTSGVTTHDTPYWGAYGVSKLALEKLVETWAAENVKTNLRVNLIDPGAVRTRMRATAFPGEDPGTLTPPEDITELFVKLARPDLADTGKRFHVREAA